MTDKKIHLIHDAKKKKEEEEKIDGFVYLDEIRELVKDEEQEIMVFMMKTNTGIHTGVLVPEDHFLEAIGMIDMVKLMLLDSQGDD